MRDARRAWWLGLTLAGGLMLGSVTAAAQSYGECVKGCKEDQAACTKVCEEKIKNPLGKQKCLEACEEVALKECLDECKDRHRR
jgi:polyferredoxin